MPFWQRLVITVVAMLVASFLFGLIWSALLGFALPSYLGGMIGGLTALPVWEFLKRVGPRRPAAAPPAGG
jgi:Na+/glutamate symporter